MRRNETVLDVSLNLKGSHSEQGLYRMKCMILQVSIIYSIITQLKVQYHL